MRAAAHVWNIKLLQAQHAFAALGQVIARRAAHAADTDDDGVEMLGVIFGECQHLINESSLQTLCLVQTIITFQEDYDKVKPVQRTPYANNIRNRACIAIDSSDVYSQYCKRNDRRSESMD